MSINFESKNRINSLISAANATTGKSDADLTTAVTSLITGFGSGASAAIEVVTLASDFSLANEAYNIFSAMVEDGKPTCFIRKTERLDDAVFLFGGLNVLGDPKMTSWTRWRASGVTSEPAWGSSYLLSAKAGDEYYKVVIE